MAVDYVLEGAVAVLTIRGDDERNLFDENTSVALNTRLAEFDADPSALACVLRGAGSAHFSAGFRAVTPGADAAAIDRFFHPPASTCDRADAVYRAAKPVIAAITGECFGEALVIVGQMSDVRIAGESARFGFPDDEDGLGSVLVRSRLLGQIPYAPLMAMVLAGDLMDAGTAHRVGLVSEIVPDADVFDRAAQVAEQICALPPLAPRLEKGAIVATAHLNFADMVHFSWAYDCVTHRHPDCAEGVAAWVEKRKPRFASLARED